MKTRRDFFKGLLALVGGAALALRARGAWAATYTFDVSKTPGLKQVGGFAVLKLKGMEILFIRAADKQLLALNAACTHAGCPVTYDPAAKKVVCGCHNSMFDVEGRVLHGPARKPLVAYPAKIEGEHVAVTLP